MQRNLECIKDVLLYLIDNINYEEYEDTWDVIPVTLNTLYQAEEMSDYSKTEIMRSTLDLINCGYIICLHRSPKDKPYLDECVVSDISPYGYRFAASVKEPTTWNKIKSALSKCGNYTLEFVQAAALQIATNQLTSLLGK